MRTSCLSVALAAAVILASLAVRSVAGEYLDAEIERRAATRRAVEAVIWGVPIVNFDRMLQAAIQDGGAANQIIYWSQPVNAQDQTLTPNPDMIYLSPFYDTRNGPIVLEIPPAEADAVIVGSVYNAWQNALEDVGPTGADEGKGGKYLITPPGYEGPVPDGYIVLRSDTYQGFGLLRSNFKSRTPADINAAVAYGKRVKLYPLGGKPGSTAYVDVYNAPFDATIPYDGRFFAALHRMVQVEPWLTRDKVMIDLLRTLGIEKGKPFEPDPTVQATLDEAAREARAEIERRYQAFFDVSFNPGTHWAVPASAEVLEGMSTAFANAGSYPVMDRAALCALGCFSARRPGPGPFHLVAIADSNGLPLDGKKSYRLTVPPNVPVRQSWSATVYDRETHAFIRHVARASRGSMSPDLQPNADGSVEIYFGPTAPEGMEANWVPTAGKDFEIMFRLYEPQPALFTREWKLPDVERVK